MAGRVLALTALLLTAACTKHTAWTCNVAVTAPQLRVDFSSYAAAHPDVQAQVCRRAVYAEPVRDCPTYRLDALSDGVVAMFAPPFGMVVTVTLTTGSHVDELSLRLAGTGGQCGVYAYPPLRVTADGRLVRA